MRTLKAILIRLTVFLLATSTGLSQQHGIPIQLFSNGGGTIATPTGRLSGALAQPVAGKSTSTTHRLYHGFYSSAHAFLIGNTPPNITHNQPGSFERGVGPVIGAVITDFDGISNARLFSRPIASSKVPSASDLTLGTNNLYSITLPAAGYDAMGIEYYFTATDKTGRERRLPPNDDDHFYAYAVEPSAVVPTELLKYGRTAADYRIISVPYVYPNKSVQHIFSSLGNADNSKWRLYHYTRASWPEYPEFTSIDRGKGYFTLISSDDPKEIAFGRMQAPPNNQGELFSMTLDPGWNLIGNPYTESISWENVRAYNTTVLVKQLKLFTGGYVNGDLLLPFQGGFVYLDEASSAAIEIPFAGQSPGGGRTTEVFTSDLGASNWKVDLTLNKNGTAQAVGGFGMHPDAHRGSDRFDDYNPPRFLEYAELNFPHPEHPLKAFSVDVVPRQETGVWEFTTARSDDNDVLLTWDNTSFGVNGMQLYLYDDQKIRLVNMRHEGAYPMEGNQKRLRFYYGADPLKDIVADRPALGVPGPNPFNGAGELIIPFTIPGSDSAFDTQIAIMNAQGQTVKTVVDRAVFSGFHEASWEGADDVGRPLSSGLYFVIMSVNANGSCLKSVERVLLIR